MTTERTPEMDAFNYTPLVCVPRDLKDKTKPTMRQVPLRHHRFLVLLTLLLLLPCSMLPTLTTHVTSPLLRFK
jgi:hypothetical protein